MSHAPLLPLFKSPSYHHYTNKKKANEKKSKKEEEEKRKEKLRKMKLINFNCFIKLVGKVLH